MPSIPIIMPQLGESIAEATIVSFLVQPGDHVEADQAVQEAAQRMLSEFERQLAVALSPEERAREAMGMTSKSHDGFRELTTKKVAEHPTTKFWPVPSTRARSASRATRESSTMSTLGMAQLSRPTASSSVR